jgi:NADH dehydrogenase
VGGPEYLSFKQICQLILEKINIKRRFVDISPVLLNRLTELLEILMPNFPTSVFWLDYLASNRTANMDVLPRIFNLLPSRMNQRLGYLQGKTFRRNWWRMITQRKRTMTRWE